MEKKKKKVLDRLAIHTKYPASFLSLQTTQAHGNTASLLNPHEDCIQQQI